MDTLFSCYLVKSLARPSTSAPIPSCTVLHYTYPIPQNCCCCSVTELCLTLCDRMGCSMPYFPVLHWVFSDSCLLSRCCHPTISFAVVPFSSCPQSFPASGSFPMSWLFASGGQSIGASASVSVLPMDVQGWFPLGLTVLISSQESSPAPQFESISCLVLSLLYDPNSHPYITTGKAIQFSSVAQLCLTLCDPMDCTTPGLPVHHQLPEFIQTHVHSVSDAIQPSHPLSSPSPPPFNLSQHRGLQMRQFFTSGD